MYNEKIMQFFISFHLDNREFATRKDNIYTDLIKY